MKKLISLLLVMITMMSFFAFDIGSASAASKATVKKIAVTNLTNKKFYVAKGKSLVLKTKVTATPNNSKNKAVTYKSNNVKIAKVNSKGKVTGVKVGNAKITVTSKINKKKKITVNVKITNPIKKITLNRSSVTLVEKKSVTLKPKFTPGKNVCKAVKYATSNKNVATVNSKGVVTAKKHGTAKITATAVDGTKQRAVCTVKAVADYSITSLNAPEIIKGKGSTRKLCFTLNRAKKLFTKDITVMKKHSPGSIYNVNCNIESVTTFDNRTYYINLTTWVDCGDYFKVNISSLTGTKAKEVYINSRNIVSDKINYVCKNVGDDFIGYISNTGSIGAVSVKVISGSLPKGIELVDNGLGKNLKGKFEEICSNQRCTIEITDEYNHKRRITYQFNVGDAKHIYGSNTIIGTKSEPYYSKTGFKSLSNIYMCGGSGTYSLALENDYGGLFSLSETSTAKNYTCLYIRTDRYEDFDVKSKYNLTVNITDANDPSIKGTINIICNFTKANKVAFFNDKFINISDYKIIAIDTKTKMEYDTVTSSNNNNRKMDILYLPDGTYNIYRRGCTYETTLISSNLKVTKDQEIKSNMPKQYTVRFVFKNKLGNPVSVYHSYSITNPRSLYRFSSAPVDSEIKLGFLYGEKNNFEIEVKNRYSLKVVATYKKEITVTKDMEIVIPVEEDKVSIMDAPDLTINNSGTYTVGLTMDYYSIVKFTPQTTRDYTIYSTGDYDTYIRSYEPELSPYDYTSNDNGGEKYNFKITKKFTAGETYYLAVRKYNDPGKIYDVNIVIE